MKVSKRDISIVMVLLGAIALFCVYQFNYKKQIEKANALQVEINQKTAENEELLQINEQDINNDITKWQTEMIAMVKKYPARYRYDDMIMYLYDMEHVEDYGVHFGGYQMTPTKPLDTFVGTFNEKPVTFADLEADFNLTFTNETYDGLKKMLTGVYADRNAKNFKEIDLKYDNITGVVSGIMVLRAYCVTDYHTLGQGKDSNHPQAEVVIPPVAMGVDCVFGPTVTPTPIPELTPVELP